MSRESARERGLAAFSSLAAGRVEVFVYRPSTTRVRARRLAARRLDPPREAPSPRRDIADHVCNTFAPTSLASAHDGDRSSGARGQGSGLRPTSFVNSSLAPRRVPPAGAGSDLLGLRRAHSTSSGPSLKQRRQERRPVTPDNSSTWSRLAHRAPLTSTPDVGPIDWRWADQHCFAEGRLRNPSGSAAIRRSAPVVRGSTRFRTGVASRSSRQRRRRRQQGSLEASQPGVRFSRFTASASFSLRLRQG